MRIELDGCEFKSKKEMCNKLGIDYDKLRTLTNKKKIKLNTAVSMLLSEKEGFIKSNIVKDTVTSFEDDDIIEEDVEDSIKEESSDDIECFVEGLDTIISNVSKYNNKNKINLIDFENVNNVTVLKEYLEENNTINIFFYNALLYSNKYYKLIKGSKSTNIPIMIFESSSQLVDQLIIFTLGNLTVKFPKKEYMIVSLDKGYDTIIDNISSLYNIKKYKNINKDEQENKNKFLYAVCKYILNNKNITQYDRYNLNDLRKIFVNFYRTKRKWMSDDYFNKLIITLEDNNILKKSDYIMEKQYYYIDLIEAANIVNTSTED